MTIDMSMTSQKESSDFTFRCIGRFDTSGFKKGLELITNSDWEEYSFRQDNFGPHKHTRTIPLLYDEKFSDFPSEWKHYNLFKDEIEKLKNFFMEYYKKGKIIRVILVKLLANSKINPHVDFGVSLMTCHRHHIAAVTHKDVFFQILDDKNHLAIDEVWEINNAAIHSVENNSDIDRIHIIVDWNTSY